MTTNARRAWLNQVDSAYLHSFVAYDKNEGILTVGDCTDICRYTESDKDELTRQLTSYNALKGDDLLIHPINAGGFHISGSPEEIRRKASMILEFIEELWPSKRLNIGDEYTRVGATERRWIVSSLGDGTFRRMLISTDGYPWFAPMTENELIEKIEEDGKFVKINDTV